MSPNKQIWFSAAVLATFTACAACNLKLPTQTYDVQPDLQHYVDEFEAKYAFYMGKPLYIRYLQMHVRYWVDDKPTTIGMCHRGPTPTITLKRSYWKKATELERKSLVWHEFGHCILNRPHFNGMISRNQVMVAVSLMHEWDIDDAYLALYWDLYERELFTGQPQ